MASVVSDSSTLIHLARINRLSLLQDMYGSVMVPPAVWREVVEEGHGRPGAQEVEAARQPGWLEVQPATNELLLRLLKRELDDGEAIALAAEQGAHLLLMDESVGRRIAELYGIPKTGVIGLLVRAKAEGRLVSLRPELERLRAQGGFWLDDELFQRALAAVEESE